MVFTNSPLVSYTRLAPRSNYYGIRTHAIDRITPHCVATEWSIEQIGACFANPNRRASCNYGIGKDGRIGLICEEKNASGCTSSQPNDERAVTIECSSASVSPYAFRDAVYASLINLCVDICKRNGKKKLLWLGTKEKALSYQPKSDEMVLTVHRWFSAKACPGDWLMARMADLANKVTTKLQGNVNTQPVTTEQPITKPTTGIKAIKASGVARRFSKALAGSYTTTDDLNMRDNAGVKNKILVEIPKGTTVQCYGYYNLSGIYIWPLVTVNLNGVQYTGYVSKAYLK